MITAQDLAMCQNTQLDAMLDRCVIRNADSWDGEVRVPGAVVWQWNGQDEIPCRIARENSAQPDTTTVGGEDVLVTRIVVTVPVAIQPIEGQVITVVSSLMDSAGAVFDVVRADPGTFLTARRVHCIEHK